MSKESATSIGVRAAWDFWISQHPHGVPDLVEAAIKAAFKEWLDEHTEEVLQILAKQSRERR